MNLKAELQKMSITDLRNVCRELGVSCPKTKRSIIKKLLLPLKKEYNFCSGWWCSGEGDTIEENTPLVSDDRKKKRDDRKKKRDERRKNVENKRKKIEERRKNDQERRKNDQERRQAELEEKKRLRKQNSDKRKNLIKEYRITQLKKYIKAGYPKEYALTLSKQDAINFQLSLN